MRSYLIRYLVACVLACEMTTLIAQSDAFGREAVSSYERESAAAGPYAFEAHYETWRDAKRRRDLPVKIIAPAGLTGPAPIIVHSHGLGGSVEGGRDWGEHWASHGYIVLHVQHPGSDEPVWKNKEGGPRA